jgi:hypothetical protein
MCGRALEFQKKFAAFRNVARVDEHSYQFIPEKLIVGNGYIPRSLLRIRSGTPFRRPAALRPQLPADTPELAPGE